ncbi:hypothetical protein PoB_006159500 [Plakobranchus ocellatus]|uniref:Uncharacterized protein n=1 Tax=Plakobranchus ocellatus TaxID=259542 RepID=A0AAV4CTF0_9GAST|nr:hypothetical protein PoB_006159500 [Plakobranchus ocellatus]
MPSCHTNHVLGWAPGETARELTFTKTLLLATCEMDHSNSGHVICRCTRGSSQTGRTGLEMKGVLSSAQTTTRISLPREEFGQCVTLCC